MAQLTGTGYARAHMKFVGDGASRELESQKFVRAMMNFPEPLNILRRFAICAA